MHGSISRWLAVALVIGIATPLAAQHPQVRKGFWIGFGPTYGSADATCDGCVSGREGSFGLFIKLGGTLSQKVLLGGEINSWMKDEAGVTTFMGSMAAVVYYYPIATGGLFVKGGPGVSSLQASGNGPDLEGYGWGVTAGVGYDIRVGRNISITPVGNFWYGQPGNIQQSGTTVITGWKQNVFEFGLGITFH